MNGLRILKPRSIALIAILVSVIGHLYLFIGFPSFLFSKAPPLEENIVAELRVEPVRKVQLSKPTAPAPSVRDDNSNAVGDGAKIGAGDGEKNFYENLRGLLDLKGLWDKSRAAMPIRPIGATAT
jgi:hypothetical protein